MKAAVLAAFFVPGSMSMKYSSHTARDIHMTLQMSKKLGSEVRVYGRTLKWTEYRALINNAFGINDNESAAAIGRKLNDQASASCPAAPGLEGLQFRMNAYSADMLQHYGINPARLILAAHNVWPRARGKDKSVSLEIAPYETDGAMDCKTKIVLAPGLYWRDGKLYLKKTFPLSIAEGLVGRSVSTIVQDGWDGWEKMKIKNVSVGTRTACITTDQVESKRLLVFKPS